jgi:hypothetical protein
MAKQKVDVGPGINATLDGTILTMVFDLSKEIGESNTGKSNIIGTSLGLKSVPMYPDPNVKVGINVFRELPEKKNKKVRLFNTE